MPLLGQVPAVAWQTPAQRRHRPALPLRTRLAGSPETGREVPHRRELAPGGEVLSDAGQPSLVGAVAVNVLVT